MPRGKSAAARRSGGRQNTLSFSGHSNKVTKAGAQQSTLQKNIDKKSEKLLAEVEPATAEVKASEVDIKVEDEPTTAELAFREQIQAEKVERTEEEEKALKISDAQVKRYWKAKEESRIAPTVHQQGMPLYDKILREFDLSSHFGPCIGIARTKRWRRAHKLGLNPPIEVLAVLMKEDAKSRPTMQRAYVDELMSSRAMIESQRLDDMTCA